MGRRHFLIVTLALAWAHAAAAAEIEGWSFVRSLPLGAAPHGVTESAAPAPGRGGGASLRFEVRPGDCSRGKHGWDDCANDRERAELKQTDAERPGDEHWYGWSLFVPEDFRNLHPANVAFAQFHQEGGAPALLFQNGAGGLSLDIHRGRRTAQLIPLIAEPDLRGRWHHFLAHIRWSPSENGIIDLWVNGARKAAFRGPTMSEEEVYFKFGLYRSYLARNPAAAGVTQVVYFDELRRGSRREEVEIRSKGP